MITDPPAELVELPEAELRARAVRTVAACAHDAKDLIELLGMLGIKATESRPQPYPAAVPAPSIHGQRGRGISPWP
jgi:hypothetical protein